MIKCEVEIINQFDKNTNNEYEIGKMFVRKLLNDYDYTKPYIAIASWDNGENAGFATEEQVKELIAMSLAAHSDEAFDVTIVKFPEGNEVNFDTEIKVTLK